MMRIMYDIVDTVVGVDGGFAWWSTDRGQATWLLSGLLTVHYGEADFFQAIQLKSARPPQGLLLSWSLLGFRMWFRAHVRKKLLLMLSPPRDELSLFCT